MLKIPSAAHLIPWLVAGLMTLEAVAPGRAETVQPAPDAPKPAHKKYPKGFVPGTPLDTLMNSHLTTTVPDAKDFVRESSPDPKSLDYTPLTGAAAADPDRPKPRDKANVEALQAELEHSMAHNAQRAHGLTAPAARHKRPAD